MQLTEDTPASRRIVADMIERAFPGDRPGFLSGRPYNLVDESFYDIFADRDLWRPYFATRGDLPGVAHYDEYLLPPETINRLRFLRSAPEE